MTPTPARLHTLMRRTDRSAARNLPVRRTVKRAENEPHLLTRKLRQLAPCGSVPCGRSFGSTGQGDRPVARLRRKCALSLRLRPCAGEGAVTGALVAGTPLQHVACSGDVRRTSETNGSPSDTLAVAPPHTRPDGVIRHIPAWRTLRRASSTLHRVATEFPREPIPRRQPPQHFSRVGHRRRKKGASPHHEQSSERI